LPFPLGKDLTFREYPAALLRDTSAADDDVGPSGITSQWALARVANTANWQYSIRFVFVCDSESNPSRRRHAPLIVICIGYLTAKTGNDK
jgi:hypothetical protein